LSSSPAKPFASSADTEQKTATLDEIAPGVLAYTAEGDPNVGAVVGRDGVVAIDARATPTAAQPWLEELRRITDKPVRYLVLTHYHAVRVLGAAAFAAQEIVASETTRDLILERGAQDWESEFRRMPRLAEDPGSVPGLTLPTITFRDRLTLHLGDRDVELRRLGRGHSAGDIGVWLPEERILFAGDLVEAEAAPYMGDAYVDEWRTTTLDAVAALGASALVPGRGAVVRGDAVGAAIEQTRAFLSGVRDHVARARQGGAGLKATFDAVHDAMAPRYGDWPIFEHCLPFNVKRVVDELDGREPEIWTADTDARIWSELQA
jgi:glyoxylase-like metal-dependent hydrolase (beta-lactamase superfamily II)